MFWGYAQEQRRVLCFQLRIEWTLLYDLSNWSRARRRPEAQAFTAAAASKSMVSRRWSRERQVKSAS